MLAHEDRRQIPEPHLALVSGRAVAHHLVAGADGTQSGIIHRMSPMDGQSSNCDCPRIVMKSTQRHNRSKVPATIQPGIKTKAPAVSGPRCVLCDTSGRFISGAGAAILLAA